MAGKKKEINKKRSSLAEVWLRLRKSPVAMLSLAGIILIVLIAIFADVIVSYDSGIVQNARAKLLAPSAEHWFGTDQFGRDFFSRVIHATRTDLFLSIVSTALSVIGGTLLGCVGAYFGKKTDMIIMRACDILSGIPGMVLAMAICAGLGGGTVQLLIALSIGGIPVHTRMIRSKAISVSSMEYMEAAGALGSKTGRTLIKHLVPNIDSMIIIQFTGSIAQNIMMCASLSFINLGVKAPTPEWGILLSDGMTYMKLSPWLAVFPGVFIVFMSLCINTFGDCLRDAFDPKLKGKI